MIPTTAAKLVLGQKEEIKFLFGQIIVDSVRKASGDRNQESMWTMAPEAGNAWRGRPNPSHGLRGEEQT